jgi:DNA invertase Pin-like site-specific DNA recombinase
VGAVVVWAIDRIGRNKVQSAHDLRELARFGARVVSVQDAWVDQPEGPMRTLMVDIVTWMSEGERARLIERTKAGLARAVAAGRKLGRRAIPDGDIEAIRLLWEKGWGAYRIARDICLKESTVRTYCRRFEASKAKANAVAR